MRETTKGPLRYRAVSTTEMKNFGIVAALVTSLSTLSGQAPPPPPPPDAAVPSRPVTTILTGRVIDAATRQPIPNAHLSTGPNVIGSPVVLADEQGRFSLPAPSGRFSAVASKTGYAREPMQVTAGTPIEIALQRAAAISGRVIDDSGEPVLGARVIVERVDANRRRATLGAFETDDRGEYRVGGLPATTAIASVAISGGTVFVRTGNQTFATPSSRRIFFPNASNDDDAERMILQPGEERGGVDFIVAAKDASNQPFSVMQSAGITPPGSADPPDSHGFVRGRVVDTDGRALAHAQVRLAFAGGRGVPPLEARTAWTDPAGGFGFSEVPAAEMRLTASHAGYFPTGQEGTGSSDPLRFSLQPGQIRDRIELKLAAWSVIEGRIVDERGDPIMDASVQLLQPHFEAGRRVLTSVLPARLTDDHGQYRIYGVMPGSYTVSSAIGQVATADVPGYGRSFLPGTDDAGAAQYLTVDAGRVISGADVALVRAPTARVSGALLDVDGRPTTGGAVALTPAGSAVGVRVGARISEGSFEFANVPPGRYIVSMSKGRVNSWTEGDFAAMPVTVAGADVTGLVVHGTPGSHVVGRIIYDASGPNRTPPDSGLEIMPVPVDPALAPSNGIATARLVTSTQFELNGITGTRRLQVIHAPPGWMVESMRANGVDLLDQPVTFGGEQRSMSVDVTMTDRVSLLKGAITDDRSRVVEGVDVLVFSRDRRDWYPSSRFLRRARTNAEGVFTIEGLPDDSYYVVASPRLPADGEDAWQEPEYLDTISARAGTVTVTAGGVTNLNLRVTPR
jgi:protocatechuate 3,4-dioxygenase beta subunit